MYALKTPNNPERVNIIPHKGKIAKFILNPQRHYLYRYLHLAILPLLGHTTKDRRQTMFYRPLGGASRPRRAAARPLLHLHHHLEEPHRRLLGRRCPFNSLPLAIQHRRALHNRPRYAPLRVDSKSTIDSHTASKEEFMNSLYPLNAAISSSVSGGSRGIASYKVFIALPSSTTSVSARCHISSYDISL